MDNTVLAGWIGFGGAFVGGGLAWLGGWLTMRSQWKRERTFRQQEQLGEMLTVATRRLADNPPRFRDGAWVTTVPEDTIRSLHFGRVLAARSSHTGRG
ncbi:hypothetical protein [Terrabacter sp. NPDC080008]|uniref:hypothetical protein n=1 Tax=Terrabacter sp. NPDC080008 TaxID=3155176 RepID=UPI00344CD943